MRKNFNDITLAFAGIFQVAQCIHDLAHSASVDEDDFTTCVNTLYKIDASDVPAVYGGIEKLRTGLQLLKQSFSKTSEKLSDDISRYVVSILILEKKFSRDKKLQANLLKRLKHAVSQAEYFSPTHQTVISNLAQMYVETLSTYQFRVQITGRPEYLQQEAIMEKIRALLLAGVRSAFLWEQLGGTRWHLLLGRTKMVQTADNLLKVTA